MILDYGRGAEFYGFPQIFDFNGVVSGSSPVYVASARVSIDAQSVSVFADAQSCQVDVE